MPFGTFILLILTSFAVITSAGTAVIDNNDGIATPATTAEVVSEAACIGAESGNAAATVPTAATAITAPNTTASAEAVSAGPWIGAEHGRAAAADGTTTGVVAESEWAAVGATAAMAGTTPAVHSETRSEEAVADAVATGQGIAITVGVPAAGNRSFSSNNNCLTSIIIMPAGLECGGLNIPGLAAFQF